MDIRKMTDEELVNRIEIIYIQNPLRKDGYRNLARFIRQCVKDSLPTEKEIENVINDWLSCGESRLSPDDVSEIARDLRKAMNERLK